MNPSKLSGKKAYKSSGRGGTGNYGLWEAVRGLRYKQVLVLLYFKEYSSAPASPSMIAQWVKQKYGYQFRGKGDYLQFCKKLHDTLSALVKRKLLYKVSYGLYAPTDLGTQVIPLLSSRVSESELRAKLWRGNREVEGGPRSRVRGGSVCAGGSTVVLRFHCFRGGFEDRVERLVVAVEVVYRLSLYLRRYFRSVLGASRWRRLAGGVSLRVAGLPVTGVHGFYCERHRPLKPLSMALPVFREVGVDVPVILGGVGDIHVKVYTAPVSVYLEHLERYRPSKAPKRLSARLAAWSRRRGG